MQRMLILVALAAAGACDRQASGTKAGTTPSPSPAAVAEAPASSSPKVVPLPKDAAQRDRMILAGFTPHGSHMHAPGVNECPLSKGSEVVM